MKTIIVATDFSPRATNALRYAVNAASQVGYSLVLFNLYNPSIHALNARASSATLNELLKNQQDRLSNACSEIKAQDSVAIVSHLATGNFLEELERCIAQHNADLVVMGMAGKSLDQDLLGNTTTAAINRLKFPVLAIPEGAVFFGIKSILYAADIMRGIQVKVLLKVKEFAKDFGATVEVFHVRETIEKIAEQDQKRWDENLQSLDIEMKEVNHFYKNVLSSKVVDAIKEELATSESDLLIMVPQKYGFWESVIHRSKTRVMTSGMDVPLLSLPL